MAGWLALIYCDLHAKIWRLVAAVFVILIVLIAKSALPRAGIEEGHNIFVYLKDGEVLQRTLPAAVFADWRQSFDRLYPHREIYDDPYSWRNLVHMPESAFAYSSDSIWRPALYSRKVDGISFESLGEFRGGFANELKYNWWRGDIDRQTMPFFTVYEFSHQSVGCKLHWQGAMFWEKSDGSLEKIVHDAKASRLITAEDVGRKAYMLFLPQLSPDFYVHLELSRRLAVSHVAGNLLSIIGVLISIGLMARIRWRTYLTAMGIVALGVTIIGLSNHYSEGKFLGKEYPPHAGGDDGLVHESHGRAIARAAASGNIGKALEGFEPVYWFTPGMRYARAVEKIIFGDTNLGYAAFIACMPLIIYLAVKQLFGVGWASIGALIFLLSPANFSFAQYVYFALQGYAEPMGSGLFFLGLVLLLKAQPRWGGNRDGGLAFLGGACLAGSMFVRPNYALAVPLLGLLFVIASWRSGDFRIIFTAAAGLSLALFMPLHNYIFGHRLVLISASGTTISLSLSPWNYIQGVYELITGQWNGPNLTKTAKQVWDWLRALPELRHFTRAVAVIFTLLRIPTLFLCVFMAFRYRKKPEVLPVLSGVALAAQIPILFIFEPQFRYAMLGWDLCIIVTLLAIAYQYPKWPELMLARFTKYTGS